MVEGRRQRGRPKLRWEDGVMGDARKFEWERNWRNGARNSVVSAGGRLTMRLHLDGHLGALPSGSSLGVIRGNYL